MKQELKFGDRVKVIDKDCDYLGQEGVFILDDRETSIPIVVFIPSDNRTTYYEREDLEILPKTRLEIMKDMVDGHKFINNYGDVFGFVNNEENEPYFTFNSEKLKNLNNDRHFKELTRLPNPIKKTLKDFNILEAEVTAEQAARIKEIIEGVK